MERKLSSLRKSRDVDPRRERREARKEERKEAKVERREVKERRRNVIQRRVFADGLHVNQEQQKQLLSSVALVN
jgi:hypothetical protein